MLAALRVGEIELPDHFRAEPGEKQAIIRLLNSRFPFEVECVWETAKTPPFTVGIYKVQQCPTLVPFEEWRETVEALKPGEIFIGLDKKHAPFIGSFRGEDPHWVFEVMSRRGKSTMVSLSIAQILHQDPGAEATGIDPKMESFKALFGVPRFTLANDPDNVEEMWARISEFRDAMYDRRSRRAKDPGLDFSYKLLVIDEANSFSLLSKIHWRNIKQQGDPPYPPVWEDLAMIMAQGAAYHCHLIMTGQRLDETIFGGLRLISMAGFRGLGGFRPANYKRLGLGGGPVPVSSTRRGRWLYNDGEHETQVQNLWATDAEIKGYAMSLAPGLVPVPRSEAAAEGFPAPAEWVTGLEAAAAHLALPLETFRKRRQRRSVPGEARDGRSPSWRRSDLDAWAADSEQEVRAS